MNVDRLHARLAAALAGPVERRRPLARLTTYRLGGPASVYVEPAGVDDLVALARVLAAEDEPVPVLTIGRGSNLVVSDRGFDGVVIRPSAFAGIAASGATAVRAGAATPLPGLANWAARRGLAGAEFTIAIPGSVGGAVRMNAGAHGADVAGVLASVEVVDLDRAEPRAVAADALGLGYRRSNVSERLVVTHATFELAPDDPALVRARMEEYRRHRAETQPGALQNAGSVFKNPPGDAAGRLVEAAGLKGLRVGGAEVSTLHANFFIAGPDARAQDVYDLVNAVRERVRRATGVDLVPEIRFVGPFEDRSVTASRTER